MSARLNIQIIQQQPLNTLLLFLPPRCHRAAPPIVRRRFIPRGKMVSLLLQFQQCTVQLHSCCCTQFQWSTSSALCSNPALVVVELLLQCRKVYTGLGFVGSTWAVSAAGGRSHCTFPASQPCSSTSPCSTSLQARVACFTCITWTVRLPWHPFLFRT